MMTSRPPSAQPAGTPSAPSQRLALRRPGRRPGLRGTPTASRPGRLLAGVCAGIAAHLGVPVALVRTLMIVTVVLGGSGVLLYGMLWVLVPDGDPWAEAAGSVPVQRARLVSRPSSLAALPQRWKPVAAGAGLLGTAGILFLWRSGALGVTSWLVPAVVIAAGTALAWAQADCLTGSRRDRAALLRLAGGVGLVAVGILLWLGSGTPPGILLTGALTGAVLVVAIGLLLVPLWLRTNRELADTRAAEAREAERADIAAHLHDSVLQTLTVIRKRAHEPETVARLARAQERELRAWLYTDRPAEGTSVADALRDLVGEIEDRHGVPVELVVVGERVPDRATEVIIAAAREALSNAVRHGEPPVSVYAELSTASLEVFVRDHGPGFDLAEVPDDRHGVRESIIGRMVRHGGGASVRHLADGTEVRLSLDLAQPLAATTPGA